MKKPAEIYDQNIVEVKQFTVPASVAQDIIKRKGKITWEEIKKAMKLPDDVKRVKIKKPNKNLTELKFMLQLARIEFVEELKFSDRKFRFDIAIPEKKIAIEYNGIFSAKSRHTTQTGYSKDREKINLAISLGWRVLEYTPLNFTNVVEDLKKLL